MQLKTTSLRSNASPKRRSCGSCGNGGIHEGAVSGVSVQTPFGGQNEGVLGGASTSGMQIPKSGICSSSICEESGEERASSHKHATTSGRCGFEWVVALLRTRLKAWDVMVAEDCDSSIDDLYVAPFSFKYVEVDASDVPHIIGCGGVLFANLILYAGCFLPSRTSQRAHMRCSSLVHAQHASLQNLPWSYCAQDITQPTLSSLCL